MKRLKICADCGTMSIPAEGHKGSATMEGMSWLLGAGGAFILAVFGILFVPVFILPLVLILAGFVFLIPIVYTLWRASTRHAVCSACESPNVIDLDTPRGMELEERYKEHNQAIDDIRTMRMMERGKPPTPEAIANAKKAERKKALLLLGLITIVALIIWLPYLMNNHW